MSQIVTHDSRSAIERARLFLNKAKACSTDRRIDFESYLEASIIFGRAAIHRVKNQHEKKKGFKEWWNSLLSDSSVEFFRSKRDFILKEGPSQVGQIINMPRIPPLLNVVGQNFEDTETDLNNDNISLSAADLYYYEDPSIPATETVEGHLNIIEHHIISYIEGK